MPDIILDSVFMMKAMAVPCLNPARPCGIPLLSEWPENRIESTFSSYIRGPFTWTQGGRTI